MAEFVFFYGTLMAGFDRRRRAGIDSKLTYRGRGSIRAALATLPGDRPPTVDDWARLSEGWRARLDEQIAALERLRDGLTSCIGCGCLSLGRCALSNPGDMAAGEGPGARWLPPALRRTPAVG